MTAASEKIENKFPHIGSWIGPGIAPAPHLECPASGLTLAGCARKDNRKKGEITLTK